MQAKRKPMNADIHAVVFAGLEKAVALHLEEKYEDAIAALGDDIENKAPSLVKRSRWTIDIGVERVENTAEKEKLFRKAVADAAKAVELDPTSFEAHKALALSKGRLQQCLSSVTQKLQLAQDVKLHIDKALELYPEDSASWTVLGAWHAGVANLRWAARKAMQALSLGKFPAASHESAEKCYLKAHEYYPNATNALQLAKTYKALKNNAKYKDWLTVCISMDADMAIYRSSQEEARGLLAAA